VSSGWSKLKQLKAARRGADVLLTCDVTQSIPEFLPDRRRGYLQALERGIVRAGLALDRQLDGAFSILLEHTGPAPPPWVLRLDRSLDRLATAPLGPAIVNRLLGIRGRERAQWTKDGRLPSTSPGTKSVNGRKVQFPRYRVEVIQELLRSPDLIQAWRRAAST
jgi:hypothetical protein